MWRITKASLGAAYPSATSPSSVLVVRKTGSGPPDPNAEPCNIPPLPEIDNTEQPETIFVDLTADSDDDPDQIIISDSDEF